LIDFNAFKLSMVFPEQDDNRIGSWQLAVGSWQLAVGSWQLAVGRTLFDQLPVASTISCNQ
jgi:hypothetical protein